MRDKIAKNLQRILKERLGETDTIYAAPWDSRRIAWEDSYLAEMYYTDIDGFQDILDEACKGTGYFIENINTVEAHICKG